MEHPDFKVIYEKFQRSGRVYECVIAPKSLTEESRNFQVILKPTYKDYLRFSLSPSSDGHWIPDNKRLVDPWLADFVGNIIVNNY